MASLIFSLNIGSEKMSVEEYVQLGWEIVDAQCIMAELVDLAWDREIHSSLDLVEELIKENNVDD